MADIQRDVIEIFTHDHLRAKHEHAEAELTMKRLDGLSPTDSEFTDSLMTLIGEGSVAGLFDRMRDASPGAERPADRW